MNALRVCTSCAALLLGLTANAEVVDTRVIEQTIPVTDAALTVIVKNVTGPVRVTAHDRDRVELRATETVRGDLQADIERARREVELRTETEPGRVAFRVRRAGDGADECDCRRWGWNDGYEIAYDIELRVPRGAAIDAATINDGDVSVEGFSGDFDVSNVNGDVQLAAMTGGGTARTVNGDVEARFAAAPQRDTSFRTVNGDLDVTLPQDLSADLEFQTLHGDVYTDFEAEALPAQPTVEPDRGRGRFVARTNRNAAFRVRSGGQALSFHTVNGDVFVRKANQ